MTIQRREDGERLVVELELILKGGASMRRDYLLAAGGAAVLVVLTITAHGQSRHLEGAMTHAQAALMQGKQGNPDALVTQAQEALKGAELARKETPNQHLDEGIRQLQTAIEQGEAGEGRRCHPNSGKRVGASVGRRNTRVRIGVGRQRVLARIIHEGLQPPIRRCDKPGRSVDTARRAGTPLWIGVRPEPFSPSADAECRRP